MALSILNSNICAHIVDNHNTEPSGCQTFVLYNLRTIAQSRPSPPPKMTFGICGTPNKLHQSTEGRFTACLQQTTKKSFHTSTSRKRKNEAGVVRRRREHHHQVRRAATDCSETAACEAARWPVTPKRPCIWQHICHQHITFSTSSLLPQHCHCQFYINKHIQRSAIADNPCDMLHYGKRAANK